MLSIYDLQLPQDLSFPQFPARDRSESAISSSSEQQHHEKFFQGGKRLYRCLSLDCGKIFKFKSEITRHLLIHFSDRPFICPVEGCIKAFKRQDALQNHSRIHDEDQRFKCGFASCDRKFVTKSALKYHILKHKDQRAFVCSFIGCNRSFITKSQLKQHEKSENYHRKVINLSQGGDVESERTTKMVKTDSFSSDDLDNILQKLRPNFTHNAVLESIYFSNTNQYHTTYYPSESPTEQGINEDHVLNEKVGRYVNLIDGFLEKDNSDILRSYEAQIHKHAEIHLHFQSYIDGSRSNLFLEKNECNFFNV